MIARHDGGVLVVWFDGVTIYPTKSWAFNPGINKPIQTTKPRKSCLFRDFQLLKLRRLLRDYTLLAWSLAQELCHPKNAVFFLTNIYSTLPSGFFERSWSFGDTNHEAVSNGKVQKPNPSDGSNNQTKPEKKTYLSNFRKLKVDLWVWINTY